MKERTNGTNRKVFVGDTINNSELRTSIVGVEVTSIPFCLALSFFAFIAIEAFICGHT